MRNIVVTGASRGIGLAVARELARAGYCVLAVARRETEELRDAAGDARTQASGDIRFISFDLEKSDEIAGFMRSLREAHGPVYGLVNNAGMSVEGMLTRLREKDIERIVRLNVLAPILVAKQAVRSMMASGEGRIVNIASIVATTGVSGLSVYAATKASMIGFTHSLAREVGALGITVNAVAPGFIETDLTASADPGRLEAVARRSALKRLTKTEDVAHAVWFLLSEKARNITGVVLTVDAGGTT
jgi:3-oxoacyl-[acyl-carrier protein] reductase